MSPGGLCRAAFGSPIRTSTAGNFGGKRVAMVPASGAGVYYAEDLLGSSRVMVQANGTLCYDADFTGNVPSVPAFPSGAPFVF